VGHQGWGKTRWKGGRRWREVARHRGSTGSAVGEQRGAVAPDGVARERSSNGHLVCPGFDVVVEELRILFIERKYTYSLFVYWTSRRRWQNLIVTTTEKGSSEHGKVWTDRQGPQSANNNRRRPRPDELYARRWLRLSSTSGHRVGPAARLLRPLQGSPVVMQPWRRPQPF
jgi:hypothetical protein